MEKVAPVHLVCGDVHIQCHGIFQGGCYLCVVLPHQANPQDFMSVSEHQIWTLTCVESHRDLIHGVLKISFTDISIAATSSYMKSMNDLEHELL